MVIPYAAAAQNLTLDPPETRTGLTKAICALDAPPYSPPRFLIQDLWPLGLAGLIVGDGGTFKSSLALHMACAVAGGYPVFDQYEVMRSPVLVVSAEDDAGTTRMRSEAFIQGHGWDRKRCLENLHILADEGVDLRSPAWPRHIVQEVERIQPGLIVLDPWADLLGDGDENSNSDVRPIVKWVRSLMSDGNRSVAIVHHMGKGGADKRALDRIRGASSLPSASRVIFFLEWAGPVVTMQNLKMSRAAAVPKFVIERDIETFPDSKLHWQSARLAVVRAGEYQTSAAETWILRMVGRNPGVGTRALKKLRGPGDPLFPALQRAITTLKSQGMLAEKEGPKRSICLSLTSSGEYALTKIEADSSVHQGPNDSDSSVHMHAHAHTEGQSEGELFSVHQRASSVHMHTETGQGPGRVSVSPLKGGETGTHSPIGSPVAMHTESADLNADALDLLAELDEREGMQEDL